MIRSSLDLLRKPVKLPLAQDEEIVMYYTASYDAGTSLSSSWRPGNLYLTTKRFLFVQITRIIFQIRLHQIRNITIVKRSWILGKKVKQLFISYETDHGRKISYIAVRNPQQWKQAAEDLVEGLEPVNPVSCLLSNGVKESNSSKQMCPKTKEMSRKIDGASLKKLGEALDPASCEILWYLWENRHARINELGQLVHAPTHMDVLLRIRERINPTAERIIGSPVLSFEKSRVDQQTGEKVLFSWWIAGEVEEKEPGERETLLDVFDEGEYITVFIELLGVREEDIRLEVAEEKLTVSADTCHRRYYEEIPLPGRVSGDQITRTFKNGILQVKLRKKQ